MTDHLALLPDKLIAKILCKLLVRTKMSCMLSYMLIKPIKLVDDPQAFFDFASTCKRIHRIAMDLASYDCAEWRSHDVMYMDNLNIFTYTIDSDFVGCDKFLYCGDVGRKKLENGVGRIAYHLYHWEKYLHFFKHRKFTKLSLYDDPIGGASFGADFFDHFQAYMNFKPSATAKLDSITALEISMHSVSVKWLDKLLSLLKNVTMLSIFSKPEPKRPLKNALNQRRTYRYLVFYFLEGGFLEYIKEYCPAIECHFPSASIAKTEQYITRNGDIVRIADISSMSHQMPEEYYIKADSESKNNFTPIGRQFRANQSYGNKSSRGFGNWKPKTHKQPKPNRS